MSRKTPKPDSSLDDSVWLELFEPAFLEDSTIADKAARLWHYLLSEIESGPEGATRVAWRLEDAVRLTFPFTKMYKACMILFQVSLGKDFPTENNSLAVLSEALKRTKAALERGPRSAKKRRIRSRRK